MSKLRTLKTQKSRFKNKKHLAWVRSLGCAVQCHECNGVIQAHHLLKPWSGERGMGMKSNDRNAIPLCFRHHHLLHTKFGDELKFFEHYTGKADYGKALAEALWDQSEWSTKE
jgi:hypothetical protein